MGGVIVESTTVASNYDSVVQNCFKDCNKKKKRRPRRSKLNYSLPACFSGGEFCIIHEPTLIETTSSSHAASTEHQLLQDDHVGFSSCPTLHVNKDAADMNLQDRLPVLEKVDEYISSAIGPNLFASEETDTLVLIPRRVDSNARQKHFHPYLCAETINSSLEKGELFRALFRVNPHNRLEAYCTIDGLETDVLISGMVAQNRAFEGDTVVIAIDPPPLWPKMKGSTETPNDSVSHASCSFQCEDHMHCKDGSKGKNKLDQECCHVSSTNCWVFPKDEIPGSPLGVFAYGSFVNDAPDNGCQPSLHDSSRQCYGDDYNCVNSIEKLHNLLSLLPSKRPTGRVVAVIENSPQRNNIVGFLSVKQWLYSRVDKKKNRRQYDINRGYILLIPTDPKLSKMTVPVMNLPGSIKKCLEVGDLMVENLLVAAKVVSWVEDSFIPEASVIHIFGRGGDLDAQIASILFENAIDASEFSCEILSCLPHLPWEVPHRELLNRRDLRNLCVFTIDPKNASDLDDALSVEYLPDGDFRVGVHVADVSYFVLPDTTVDIEAQIRSTSVYLLQRRIPMLPPVLSDGLASLNPGVDRLTFSIFWRVNSLGEVLDQWIDRTIVCSSCKLSYEHAQDIIDGSFDVLTSSHWGNRPKLYGQFEWFDVIKSVKILNNLSKVLKEIRFKGGALSLERRKVAFLFNEEGIPIDVVLSERKDSNFLVEEFMLLANRTVAEVITRAYPSCALLRRHPEPNMRKLREFETFCHKHGLELENSSSAHLHNSLEHIRQQLKNDSVLFDIVMSYAAKPMQAASYFCSADLKESDSEWGHYALAVPLYTHFTSPLRRYPDILVHRILSAILEAENMYLQGRRMVQNVTGKEALDRCFTGMVFDVDEIESLEAQEALSVSAAKFGITCGETLTVLAAHCNKKKLATRYVKDAIDKLYMWVLIKEKKILYSDARVLGLGPRFMSVYVSKLSMERRIYYDEIEDLTAEWLDATSTLVLSHSMHKRVNRRSIPGKCKAVEEVALIVNPTELELDMDSPEHGEGENGTSRTCDLISHEPCVFPLIVNTLSTIPIALHAVGGDDGPIDIVARLYLSSYFQ